MNFLNLKKFEDQGKLVFVWFFLMFFLLMCYCIFPHSLETF